MNLVAALPPPDNPKFELRLGRLAKFAVFVNFENLARFGHVAHTVNFWKNSRCLMMPFPPYVFESGKFAEFRQAW